MQKHFSELQEIISIGPKISSFYLRDLVCIYDLEEFLLGKDLKILQPIDTWVRQVAYQIGLIKKMDEKDFIVRNEIVNACNELGEPSIKFNQGAWYLGANSFEIVMRNLDKI